MIITKTPYRISFFGGGTDFPVWYEKNKSQVISTTINKYSYIVLRDLPSIFNYKFRIRYYFREEVKIKNKIKHPVVRELLLRYPNIKSLDMNHHGDLPARTGIGSSSSFTVGFIQSLNALKNYKLSKFELAKQSINFEQRILKETVGSQDQIASSYGGFNKISFFKDSFKVIKFNQNHMIKELEKWCCLFYLGNQRSSKNIEKKKFHKLSKKKIKVLNHMSSICLEAEKLIKTNKNENLKYFAQLLKEQWNIKKQLNKMVSSREIDSINDYFLSNGALGGKVIGAGGGGFYLAMIPPNIKENIIKKTKLPHIDFNFENKGSLVVLNNKD